ncbi:peptidase S28 [Kipferlia bialata]|uniref:Peptidase S28 n=1 Tax=Kipferlia bialata TaxID=797122 RepID=A0A9K3GM79_9EUKA|nr:peptidase S28 [Kipferlia bialata]|eukprot:g9554.t1
MMKGLLLATALLVGALCAPWNHKYHGPAPSASDDDGALWFDGQFMTHFDLTDRRTWSQRFFKNDEYHQEGGPVFLMIGGEGPESERCVSGHYYYNNFAQEMNGLILCLEHRFYGASVPTADTAMGSMELLTSEQGLEDLVHFKRWYAETFLSYEADWVVVGGSYSGALAAWARSKYPHQFAAALASSAPVRTVYAYPEYLEVIKTDIGPVCSDRVDQAIQAATTMLETVAGRKELTSLFNLCDMIGSSDMDKANFMESITDPLAGVCQYASGTDVQDACDIVLEDGMCSYCLII